jgi:hypothetical protein
LIIGNATLSAANETALLAGQLYINVHTAANPNGEIRAQLVESTNNAPTIECPVPASVECTSHDDNEVDLFVDVADEDGDELMVVWTIDGVAQDPVVVPAKDGPIAQEVSFTANLDLGAHTVSVAVSDGKSVAVSCQTTVTVEDSTDPVITKVTASPQTLWPPNNQLRDVNIAVKAEDACGEVTTKILSVTSNEDTGGEDDWVIVDEDTVQLRAQRLGKNKGRVYTITVEATDEAGNTATKTTKVTVAKSRGIGHGQGPGHGHR